MTLSRITVLLPSNIANDELKRLQELGIFVATKDSFLFELRNRLAAIGSMDTVLIAFVNGAASLLESAETLSKDDHIHVIKLLLLSLFLLDEDGDPKEIFKKKKIKVDRITKIFKVYSLSFTLFNHLLRILHISLSSAMCTSKSRICLASLRISDLENGTCINQKNRHFLPLLLTRICSCSKKSVRNSRR